MGGEKRWPLVEGPPISVGRLVLMLTTVGEQLMFLMKHDIISDNGLCHKCDQVITGEWVVKGNGRYWRCKDCAVMTSCCYGTVLYQSKMKIKNSRKEFDYYSPLCPARHHGYLDLHTGALFA